MKLPNIIAHRGGRKWAPENTLSAFRKSLELGVYGVELDIQCCSTGELVVIHDDDIQRTTNGVGLVKDVTYAELKRLSAGLWFDRDYKEERIPLLQEVLDLAKGRMVLNIEIKNAPVDYPGIEDNLLELLDDYQYKDKIVLTSFDHAILQRIHQKAPTYTLALLAIAIFANLKDYAARVGTVKWHPNFDVLRSDVVIEAHEAGLEVNAWTVNSTRDWSKCIAMNLDGIITDDPEGLKAFLENYANVKTGVS